MTTYPLAGDYQAVLQHPDSAFTVPPLRKAQFDPDGWGLPAVITGTSAAVFKAKIVTTGYALRCYTRQDASSPERYAAFGSFVAGNGLGQRVGQVIWHDRAVKAKGNTWPVLQMEWIEGQRLNDYVGFLAENANKDALAQLASQWLELVNDLQGAQFAHGDLQHGNVMVDQQGHLRLVDFDGVWIPPLQGDSPPTEVGHDNYQPQGRTAEARWGPWMDTFSALVIYLALTALAREPELWLPLNNGDNLLFERKDFGEPYQTDVWKQLASVRDAEVDRLADKLRTCCAPGWAPTKPLSAMLQRTWWQATSAASATKPRPGPATAGPTMAPPPPPATWSTPLSVSPPTGPSVLPPPPAWPYQTKVAPLPQVPAAAGAQSWTSAIVPGQPRQPATSPSGIPVWWQQQQAPAPAPARAPAPVKPSSNKRTVGWLLLVSGVILFFVLLAVHVPLAAFLIGGAGIGTGLGLINSAQTRKPPGQLPPPGPPPPPGMGRGGGT